MANVKEAVSRIVAYEKDDLQWVIGGLTPLYLSLLDFYYFPEQSLRAQKESLYHTLQSAVATLKGSYLHILKHPREAALQSVGLIIPSLISAGILPVERPPNSTVRQHNGHETVVYQLNCQTNQIAFRQDEADSEGMVEVFSGHIGPLLWGGNRIQADTCLTFDPNDEEADLWDWVWEKPMMQVKLDDGYYYWAYLDQLKVTAAQRTRIIRDADKDIKESVKNKDFYGAYEQAFWLSSNFQNRISMDSVEIEAVKEFNSRLQKGDLDGANTIARFLDDKFGNTVYLNILEEAKRKANEIALQTAQAQKTRGSQDRPPATRTEPPLPPTSKKVPTRTPRPANTRRPSATIPSTNTPYDTVPTVYPEPSAADNTTNDSLPPSIPTPDLSRPPTPVEGVNPLPEVWNSIICGSIIGGVMAIWYFRHWVRSQGRIPPPSDGSVPVMPGQTLPDAPPPPPAPLHSSRQNYPEPGGETSGTHADKSEPRRKREIISI